MQEEFLQDTELKTKSSSRQIEPLVSTHFLPPEKFILDVCCGCRQFWFDKKQANTVYMDIRREEKGFQDVRPNKEIQPDIVADFRRLPFPDERFKFGVNQGNASPFKYCDNRNLHTYERYNETQTTKSI